MNKKRNWSKKISYPLKRAIDEHLEVRMLDRKDEISVEGFAPTKLDIDEELEEAGGKESDPYYEESARFHRNPDDPMGGVGINFGDW
jgi:hypothetical protein